MNKQEIFNTVATHLLHQKKRSVRETEFSAETCAYRGSNGLKCAVGVLIKDEHYHPELEGKVAFDPDVENAVRKSIGRLLDNVDLELLTDLQIVHDHSAPDEWEEALGDLSYTHDFSFSPAQLKEVP